MDVDQDADLALNLKESQSNDLKCLPINPLGGFILS